MDLLLAVFLCGLGLVQTLQRAVVPLVQLPAAYHGNIFLPHFAQCQGKGVIRPLQIGGIRQIEMEALCLHQLTGGPCLFDPLGGQVHVRPAGEAVLQVPFAFSMAQQYQCFHCKFSFLCFLISLC